MIVAGDFVAALVWLRPPAAATNREAPRSAKPAEKPLKIHGELSKQSRPALFFGKLKKFKRIAMRADKTDQGFAAIVHLAAAVINSR